eukprot:Rmarinus@m.938
MLTLRHGLRKTLIFRSCSTATATKLTNPARESKRRVHSPPPEEADVAVVGCGSAGLMAGALLAKNGLKVACFDHHYVAGGCATQFGRQNKWRFDVGLHYLGDCQPGGGFDKMLRAVGIEDMEFVPMDQDGFDTLVFPDFEFRIPAGIDKYEQRLLEMFPSEKKGIDKYASLLRACEYIGGKMEGGGKLGALDMWKARAAIMQKDATIGSFLDAHISDIRLKAVLLGQSGDYGVAPSRASALLHCFLANHYFHGAWYPKGGGQAISDRLAHVIEENGGSIHLRRGIDKILVENGEVRGVVTQPRKGESLTVRTKAVIAAGDLEHMLCDLLGSESVSSDTLEKTTSYEPAAGLFMTCCGIHMTPEQLLSEGGMRNTNYWVFTDYDVDRMYDNARSGLIGQEGDFGCYITSASLKDPKSTGHSPPGHSTMEVITLCSTDPAHWGVTWDEVKSGKYRMNAKYQETKNKLEQQMLGELDRLFPAVRKNVVFHESATPMSHRRFTRGSAYGVAATPEQFLAGRQSHRGPVKGLYLAGHSTRSGHGVAGAMMGGRTAASMLLKRWGS